MHFRTLLIRSGLTLSLASALFLSGCQSSSGSSAATESPSAPPSATVTPSPTESAAPSPSSSPVASTPASSKPSTKPTPSPAVSMSQATALRLANDKTGWAGGDGWIARTDDGGKSWNVQYSEPYKVIQIFALNDSKVWATLDIGGSKGPQLIRSTDGGKSWSKVGVVPNASFIHFTNDNDAFSGNARTTDGGATWTTLAVPGKTIGDAYFHDLKNGWAVQQVDGRILFMHSADGGQTWTTVMTRATESPVTGTVIRSAGKNDAWIELIGDSGMSQTSYSLFHTEDGGKTWLPAIAKNTAGAGPAPGFSKDDKANSEGTGSRPGQLYVASPKIAFMGGDCPACDKPKTVMETTDGGKSWAVRKEEFAGYGEGLIAATDAKHVWMLANDTEQSAVLYTSSNGGASWSKVHTFK